MSTPIGEQTAVAQKVVADAKKLWLDAAAQSDSAEGLGIDGRITLVHGLVDLWVKGCVTWLDLLLKNGAAFFPGTAPAAAPLPSEPVTVAPKPFTRTVECACPLERVGQPAVKIPTSAVAFEPAVLPPGHTEFRLVLTNHSFVGANYTATIRLTPNAPGPDVAAEDLVPEEKVVTVGL